MGVSCQIRRGAVQNEAVVTESLSGTAFSQKLSNRVSKESGPDATAVLGELSVGKVSLASAPSTHRASLEHSDEVGQRSKLPGWVWLLIGAGAGFLGVGAVSAVVLSVQRRKGQIARDRRSQQHGDTAV